jgi:hypothetical protein
METLILVTLIIPRAMRYLPYWIVPFTSFDFTKNSGRIIHARKEFYLKKVRAGGLALLLVGDTL